MEDILEAFKPLSQLHSTLQHLQTKLDGTVNLSWTDDELPQSLLAVFVVYGLLKHSLDEPGLSRDTLQEHSKGFLTNKQLENVLSFLISEGHIHKTVDGEHFKTV